MAAVEHELEGVRVQILFREINERIEELNDERAVDGELLCECSAKGCVGNVPVTRDEYERVRRVPTRFVVLPGHDAPQMERVVERSDHHHVVEKFGSGAIAAARLDPRRRGRSSRAGASPIDVEPSRTFSEG